MTSPSKEVADIYTKYGINPNNIAQPRTTLNIGKLYNALNTNLNADGSSPKNALLYITDDSKRTPRSNK